MDKKWKEKRFRQFVIANIDEENKKIQYRVSANKLCYSFSHSHSKSILLHFSFLIFSFIHSFIHYPKRLRWYWRHVLSYLILTVYIFYCYLWLQQKYTWIKRRHTITLFHCHILLYRSDKKMKTIFHNSR
jgi:hypothetical protein